MRGFKKFIKEEDGNDIEKSLHKIPKTHRNLVHGYKIIFEPNHTLRGDDGHVGMITNNPKQIRLASPFNYGREFALLHEVGHLVWAAYVKGTALEQEWNQIAANTKDKKKDENAEELFCHAYADTYAKNKIVIHHHPEWEAFINKLPN
jgi:hypothetical protein